MLNENERAEAFQQALQQIIQTYGYTIVAQLAPSMVGNYQNGVVAELRIVPLSGWTPPPDGNGTPNDRTKT